jgi:beta-glucosidase-like glycosyl hydrolase
VSRLTVARLLFPALRWQAESGFAGEAATVETALELGVGGFCLFGGTQDAVRALTAMLRAESAHRLLIASDLERGAGQQFGGATALPPPAALGALDDLDVTRRAAALTAREALALGVNWIYAPVADVDVEPRNPIIGTRAFGADPAAVARHVAAWIEGCRTAGALSCAKHFPGHGRTVEDSHATLPVVLADATALEATDLVPFRAAIEAGTDSVMTAHVAFPALDPSARPATRSAAILQGLLRGRLGFEGLVATDALIMEGALEGGEARATVEAVAAGCDAALYPRDLRAVARALDAAAGRALTVARIDEALARLDAAAERAPAGGTGGVGGGGDATWAADVARRACVVVRGRPRCDSAVQLVTIDDDVGGPYPAPPRDAFPAALALAGARVHAVDHIDEAGPPVIVAVYADIRAWKGRPGLSPPARARLERTLAAAPDATVVLFGHPRLAVELSGGSVLAAWGGEPHMQTAAAARLTAHGEA